MGKSRGFTLIELLIVVAIIGIIAAIAIPNLLNAINRGRQKRTMADMRAIATALDAYEIDWNRYPTGTGGPVSAFTPFLTPTYIKRLPQKDGWNEPMCVWLEPDGSVYSVFSLGKPDGTQSGCNQMLVYWDGRGGPTRPFSADIIFSGGQFTQWPEGMQTN